MKIHFSAGCDTHLSSLAGAWAKKTVLFLALVSAFPTLAFENCTSIALSELEKCSANNYQQEDRLLNFLYNAALAAAAQDQEPIRNVQRQWLKARDSLCTFTPQDGAEYKVYKNSCLYEQTRERNRELEAIITHQWATGGSRVDESNTAWRDYLHDHCKLMRERYADDNCEQRNRFLHRVQ